MRKYILILLAVCLISEISVAAPQRKRKKKADVEVAETHVKHKPTVYMDISSKRVEARTIKANIDKKLKAGCDTLFITVFSNTGAAVKCPTFENFGVSDNRFTHSASLMPSQLSSIVANGGKAKIVVVVNLFTNNTHFEAESGHPLFSNEGMRFVDDYLRCVFYGTDIPLCRINTDCTKREEAMFIAPLIEKMKNAGVKVILHKF